MRDKLLVGMLILVSFGVVSCSRESPEEPAGDRPGRKKGMIESVSSAPKAKPGGARQKPARLRAKDNVDKSSRPERKQVVATEDRTDLSLSDKQTLLAIEKALENEDLKAARSLAAEGVKATSAEVRSECVDMLGWFGVKTLAELTPFLSDPDADVAENALSTWTMALNEIESEARRCQTVEGVMKVLRNEDSLETLMTEVSDCDDALVMQTVVGLIGCDNEVAAKVAREHYEFMTGDEFTTVEAAEKWLQENSAEEGN